MVPAASTDPYAKFDEAETANDPYAKFASPAAERLARRQTIVAELEKSREVRAKVESQYPTPPLPAQPVPIDQVWRDLFSRPVRDYSPQEMVYLADQASKWKYNREPIDLGAPPKGINVGRLPIGDDEAAGTRAFKGAVNRLAATGESLVDPETLGMAVALGPAAPTVFAGLGAKGAIEGLYNLWQAKSAEDRAGALVDIGANTGIAVLGGRRALGDRRIVHEPTQAPTSTRTAEVLQEKPAPAIPAEADVAGQPEPQSKELNATQEIIQPPGVRGEPESGTGSGQAQETGPGDSLQPAEQSTSEGTVISPKPITPAPAISQPSPPGIIAGTKSEAWADKTIAASRAKLFTGIDPELLAAYTVKGAALIERGIRNFAEWSKQMIDQHGDGIRPYLSELYANAHRALSAIEQDAPAKTRKFAARAAISPDVPAEVRERLSTSPSSLYRQQHVPEIADRVADMSEEELQRVPVLQPDGPDNIYVAAQIERFNRRFAAGDNEGGYQIIDHLAHIGTSMGQLVNQLKQLKSATPDGVIKILNRRLAQAKQPLLSPAEIVRIMAASDPAIEATRLRADAEKAWLTNPTDANWHVIEQAATHEFGTSLRLQKVIHAVQPKGFFDMLTSLEQGNVLTSRSQLANVIENVNQLIIGGYERVHSSLLDVLDAAIRSRPREIAVAPTKTIPAVLRAQWRALRASGKTLLYGLDDEATGSKLEGSRGMHPLLAWRDLASRNMADRSRAQKAIMMLEASPFAMAATPMLRMLGAGDIPFRRGNEARYIVEQFELKKKSGRTTEAILRAKPKLTAEEAVRLDQARRQINYTNKDVRQAMVMPEFYFDKATVARIKAEAQHMVFQQPNAFTRHVLSALSQANPFVRFAIRSGALFITTPVNYFGAILSRTPAGLIDVIKYAAQGNSRAAKMAAGKVIVGAEILALGYYLYKRGAITPSLDLPEDANKIRELARGTGLNPGSINLSVLERLARGKDASPQAGDRVVGLTKFGVIGALLSNAATATRQGEMQPAGTSKIESVGNIVGQSAFLSGNYALSQSFLSGVNSLGKALLENQVDGWLRSTEQVLVSTVLPNTLTTLSQATRTNKPDLRGDSRWQSFVNIIRDRVDFAAKTTQDLPLRRDLWGAPIPETPTGAAKYAYQFLDITRSRTAEKDPLGLTVYGLWRASGDASVIPTPPTESLTVNRQDYRLSREQTSRLQQLVGGLRRRVGEMIVDKAFFALQPNAAKIEILKKAWDESGHTARGQFFLERHGELKLKDKPAWQSEE